MRRRSVSNADMLAPAEVATTSARASPNLDSHGPDDTRQRRSPRLLSQPAWNSTTSRSAAPASTTCAASTCASRRSSSSCSRASRARASRSLAFDTLYAEGQRRYVESLSAYARQFLGQMEKPKYDTIRGLSPTISIEQKTDRHQPALDRRHDHRDLRLPARALRARRRAALPPLRRAGRRRRRPSRSRASSSRRRAGTQRRAARAAAREPQGRAPRAARRAAPAGLRAAARRRRDRRERGPRGARQAQEAHRRGRGRPARGRAGPAARASTESVETALRKGEGMLIAPSRRRATASSRRRWPARACGAVVSRAHAAGFSFNSPQGMCVDCNGLGARVEIDPALVVPDESLSIDEGAVKPWGEEVSEKTSWARASARRSWCSSAFPSTCPGDKLGKRQRELVLHGAGERQLQGEVGRQEGRRGDLRDGPGRACSRSLMRRFTRDAAPRARSAGTRSSSPTRACSTCGGTRLRAESAAVRVADAHASSRSRRSPSTTRARSSRGLALDGRGRRRSPPSC